jgi:class 3 adenylate cyclase
MPLKEAFQARLMLALYRAGRQAEALDVYLRARDVLDRELGVDPGPDLEALQRAVLAHDPGLAVARLAGRQGTSPTPFSPAARAATAPDTPSQPGALPTEGASKQGSTRRMVTAVMAQIQASTLTGQRIDPETERDPLDRGFERMTTVLEGHGGLAERVVGDAVMAVFGVPVAHEDDALRAVRATAEMRDALVGVNQILERERGVKLTFRTGVNTGEVVAGRDIVAARLMNGATVNAAAQLEQAAGPGEILMDAATYGLVRSAVEAEPASVFDHSAMSNPAGAFRLLAVTPGVRGHARRFDIELVGRAAELRQLQATLDHVIATHRCQLFTVLGAAGVGKSRLVHEFLRSARSEARVLRGRCLPYGERVAFWPLIETIRQAIGIDETEDGDVVRESVRAVLRGNPRASAVAERVQP